MSQALPLLIAFIKEIDNAYDEDSITDLDIAIATLDEVLQEDAQDVAKKIDQLLTAFEACLAEHPNASLLNITKLFSIIIDVIESYPKLGKNNKNRCVRILRAGINIMTKVPYEIEENWLNPPNGYSEQTQGNENSDAERQILRCIDSICDAVGRSLMASNFEPIFKEYLQIQTDWRYPYAALMLASQLSGLKIKLQKLHSYIQSAVRFFQSPSPKIRYACFCLIGQYSDEMKPQFQQKYYNFVIPSLVKHLQDPVPRVAAHDLACFTNFFENINQVWNIQSCIGQILPPIIHYLKNSSSWVKENAISTLASLATTTDAFGPNLTQILEIANEIISTYAGVPEYTQLTNQTFQLISLILTYQKTSEVEQYVQSYVTLLLNHRQHISGSYFLNSWGRLCYRYQSFIDIGPIFDILMETVQTLLLEESDEQANQAFTNLNFTCKSFKTKLFPYIQRIFAIAKGVFEDKDNRSSALRQMAVSIMVKIVVETYCQTPQLFQTWTGVAKLTIQYIALSIDKISQLYEDLPFLYQALKDLIVKSINIFSQAEIYQFASLIKLYEQRTYANINSQSARKKQIEDEFKGSQVEQNESEFCLIQKKIEVLYESLQNVSQIYQALLNVGDASTKQWLIYFIMQQSSAYIDKTGEWKLFGLTLIVTILQKTQYGEIKDHWNSLVTLCLNHTSHPHTRTRNIAIYGLGLIIEGTPVLIVPQETVMNWLQSLWNAFTNPYLQDLDDNLILHCNDNIVSALGKLIHRFGEKFPVMLNQQIYQHWISKLPLNTDKLEGDIQQKYLMELLSKNPGIIVSNSDDLRKICVIFASFLSKRHDYNKQVMNLTKVSLRAIMNWPLFKESENYLWNNLTSSQINLLTRFIAN